jgi:Holliday junction resolvase RusA-like endonuclease
VTALGTLHRVKPDAPNILKGIEDCLWPDGDQALAAGEYNKRWDRVARLEVEIVTMDPAAGCLAGENEPCLKM